MNRRGLFNMIAAAVTAAKLPKSVPAISYFGPPPVPGTKTIIERWIADQKMLIELLQARKIDGQPIPRP